jgi:hypothetical protein
MGRLLRHSVLCKAVLGPVLPDKRHVCREVVLHIEGRFAWVEDGGVGRHFGSCDGELV